MPLSKQLIIFIMISITPALALSAGFSIQEQSTKGLGRALSGSAAIAEDASTIFFNPAGLTQLKNNEFILGSNFLFSDSSFEDKGSTGPTLTGAQPLTGKTEGINFFVNNAGSYAFIPNLYYAHILTQDLVVGLGITAPFGLASDYDDTWIGRYHALHSSLIGININPSFGYKWNDKLSVGFGISAQYSKIKLSNAIDFGSLCAISLISTCAGESDPSRDGKIVTQAKDLAWGYNFGFTYQLSEMTRLGLSYRSKIAHNFKGHGRYELPDSVSNSPLASAFVDDDIFGSLDLPENIIFSSHHRDGKWQYTTDITWTRWSRFQELKVNAADPDSNINSTTPTNWKNTFRIATGIDYQLNPQWQIRTGIAYDESPVSDQFRDTRIPGEDRYWLSFGLSHQLTPDFHVDAAYVHVIVNDPTVDKINDEPLDHRISGKYTVDIDIVSLQLRWQFD
ncbi:MAG TPA: long-chain fatty acid transporter [Gammaproteobacteria bacterium]|nr:long-chain fatty acid transporter [Gammaproteobacteria bacterium]